MHTCVCFVFLRKGSQLRITCYFSSSLRLTDIFQDVTWLLQGSKAFRDLSGGYPTALKPSFSYPAGPMSRSALGQDMFLPWSSFQAGAKGS